jgi:hypothetical protein
MPELVASQLVMASQICLKIKNQVHVVKIYRSLGSASYIRNHQL